MDASPKSPHFQTKVEREREVREDDNEHPNVETHLRICDFCGKTVALLFCRADSAKLCLSCDRQVHSTNQLFTKHTRCLLCDACDSSPASVLCSTDDVVVCQNCDWERHSHSVSALHDRRPLEGFTGCPSVSDLLSIVGFEDENYKALFGDDRFVENGVYDYGLGDLGDGFEDLLGSNTPFVSLDDLIASTDFEQNFQAIGVPSMSKSHNVASGQYKEEMLRQLCELGKLEPDFSDSHGVVELQSLAPDNMYSGFENAGELDVITCFKDRYNEEKCLVPDKDSDTNGRVGNTSGDFEVKPHHNSVNETTQVIPKVSAYELTGEERDSAISRYKEKRKTRRYDKHVRYESRKVRAETRTRIQGRFAK